MFVRDGAVTPGPSSECDITFFAKGRPKSARQSRDSTVAARRVQSVTVPSSRVSRECRSPGLRSPPLKNARKDPSALKIVRRANSLRREKNATATAKRYGECSEVLVFLGKRGRKTVRVVKNYGGSKIILRIRVPYYF